MAPLRWKVGRQCVICSQAIPQTDGVQLGRLERRQVHIVHSMSWNVHLGCNAALIRTLAPYIRICPWVHADNQSRAGILSLEPTAF
jgi:hypothetical protein